MDAFDHQWGETKSGLHDASASALGNGRLHGLPRTGDRADPFPIVDHRAAQSYSISAASPTRAGGVQPLRRTPLPQLLAVRRLVTETRQPIVGVAGPPWPRARPPLVIEYALEKRPGRPTQSAND
jgi:hypothetical protein